MSPRRQVQAMTIRVRSLLVAALLVACTPTPQWTNAELGALASAEDLELVTLHPRPLDGGDFGTAIADYRELGRAPVAPADRQRLVASLDGALRPADPQARCFWPRHALTGTTSRGRVEALICFECHTLWVGHDSIPIDASGSTVIEELRVAAELPIAD